MKKKKEINPIPNMETFWESIGYNFEDMKQVIHEFVDNSISNYLKYAHKKQNRDIYLTFENDGDIIHFKVEDYGTGLRNLEDVLRLGGMENKNTTLNEHGFGLKQALAACNPDNHWVIKTRTKKDSLKNQYKIINSPYQFHHVKVLYEEGNCLSQNETGTLIEIDCSKGWFHTIRNGYTYKGFEFDKVLNLLIENLGVYYSYLIEERNIKIHVIGIDKVNNKKYEKEVKSIFPIIDYYLKDGQKQSIYLDLGNGKIRIDYYFAMLKPHPDTKNYYQKNMKSSGIEIRINGRFIQHLAIEHVWTNVNHPMQNGVFISLNLISDSSERLPSTKTTKTGLNEADPKTQKIYNWLRLKEPNISKLIEKPKEEDYIKDIIESCHWNDVSYSFEYGIYKSSKSIGKLHIPCLIQHNSKTIIIFMNINKSIINTLYEIEKQWDRLFMKDIQVSKAIYLAQEHPIAVKNYVKYINSKMSGGAAYCIELMTIDEFKNNSTLFD